MSLSRVHACACCNVFAQLLTSSNFAYDTCRCIQSGRYEYDDQVKALCEDIPEGRQ